ncbi:TRAP transporter permease [bacterium]|nr:TRAP transporter permease [bacterium]
MSTFGDTISEGSRWKGRTKYEMFIAIFSLLFIIYHIIYISDALLYAGITALTLYIHMGIHIGFVLSLTFLLIPARQGKSKNSVPWYDSVLIVLSLIPTVYYAVFGEYEIFRYFGETLLRDVALGWLMVFLLLEASRRLVGPVFSGIVFIAALYPLVCNYLPGFLHGRGYSFGHIGEYLFLSGDGMFGVPLAISSTVIIMFLFFAQFVFASGAGQLLNDFASALMGHVRGGPAKAAVVASGLFGSLSGSSVANVAITGSVTIPLMKRIGYKPYFAAAVECVASNGGQYMPPVMGVAIFVLVEYTGIPYSTVIVSAAIPACLYYIAILFMVDFEAAKIGLKGIPREELPSVRQTVTRGYLYALPVALLLYLLIGLNWSAQKAALWSAISLLVLGVFWKTARLSLLKILDASEHVVRTLLQIAVCTAAVGIIIGSISVTGLGITLTGIITGVAGGQLWVVLVLAAIASLILGMGLPSIPCYVFLAIMVGPILETMKVPLLPAHLFFFYFGVASFITPPVCFTAYVAAGIAEAPPMKTGFQAMRLGLVAYIIPFAFVLSPALLLIGSPVEILATTVTAAVGIIALAGGLEGYILTKVNWLERIMLITGSLLLILPGGTTDIIGFALVAVPIIHQGVTWKAKGRVEAITKKNA